MYGVVEVPKQEECKSEELTATVENLERWSGLLFGRG